MPRIGFMQGRLSPMVDGKIQAFPWLYWEQEFGAAAVLGLPLIEWTLDQDRLHDNPLLTSAGRARIAALSREHGVRVESVTGDCFMQAPFFKASGAAREALLRDLEAVIEASAAARARHLVFPLVDNGSVQTKAHADDLRRGLESIEPRLRSHGMRIVFESDFGPQALAEFIAQYPAELFGINYDIGNSAALGYDPREEIGCYGARVNHVHVKDRKLRGTTVPLGEGDADFNAVFEALRATNYRGDFILQTARAQDGRHAEALGRYREMVRGWLESHGFGS